MALLLRRGRLLLQVKQPIQAHVQVHVARAGCSRKRRLRGLRHAARRLTLVLHEHVECVQRKPRRADLPIGAQINCIQMLDMIASRLQKQRHPCHTDLLICGQHAVCNFRGGRGRGC